MADTKAIQFVEHVLTKADAQTRAIIRTIPVPVEIDTAMMLLGSGAAVISTGIAGAWGFDFPSRITGWWIQEFDGTSGSVELDLQKAARGTSPSFASIVASAPPAVSSARYADDAGDLTGWDTLIERGDIVRLHVESVSSFERLIVGLRLRRLEP